LVRCVVVTAPGQAIVRPRHGARVVDTAAPIRQPLAVEFLPAVIASIRHAKSAPRLLETGIKAIDLLCPLPAGGLIGLIGDMQTGKMVLVEELIHRLGGASESLSILVFVEAATEVSVIQRFDYRTSATVEAIYLPVADAGPAALAAATAQLDAVITLSRRLAKQGLYPAIDPVRSTSRSLDPAVVGQEHCDVALAVRRLLEQTAQSDDDEASSHDALVRQRGAQVQHFLTQPFYVAEAFTKRPGRTVSRETAVSEFRALLDGAHDSLSEDVLVMIGNLAEATTG
jgi:F0F1-type ATP synthase beta subunit